MFVSIQRSNCRNRFEAYLKLNLGLGNILLAATAVGNLLGLCYLCADSLSKVIRRLLQILDVPKSLTSAEKSSRGKPSTALMLSWESGWTTAKPPDTVVRDIVS